MFRTKPYFTVFGGSYVPEHHADYCFEADGVKRTSSSAASWLVCSTLVAAISVFAVELSIFSSHAYGLF